MGCWVVFVCTDSCTGTGGAFGGANWAGKDSPVCSMEFVKWVYYMHRYNHFIHVNRYKLSNYSMGGHKQYVACTYNGS